MYEGQSKATIVSLTPRLFKQLQPHHFDDLIETANPDAFLLSCTEPHPEVFSEMVQTFSVPCLYPAGQKNGDVKHTKLNGVDVVWMKEYDGLFNAADLITNGTLNTDTPTFYFTTDIDVEVRPTRLEAELVNEKYYNGFHSQSPGSPMFLTTQLDASYEQSWNGVMIRGASPIDADLSVLIPILKLYSDGLVAFETIRNSRLGLRAIEAVGKKTAEKLVNNGYDSFEAIATTPKADLKEIRGIGKKKGETIQSHAKALAFDKVVQKSLEPLPGTDPLFINIETDGATPTVIWQISVLDSKTNEFHCFMHDDPNDKERVVGDFLDWYMRHGEKRYIVSWNGWDFDFAHIERFTKHHAEFFYDVWKNADKLGLRQWAVDDDNMILPSRTNTLEAVSEALGFERSVAELSGNRVAAVFREWVRVQNTDSQPDWELYEKYGKDNVEALQLVYNKIDEEAPSRSETMKASIRFPGDMK